ncbi:PAS/PAC sensor signal transduction histidine kinase [Thauera linaloolentis 47Lol = DSM 12138]|uniref:histidine kinase n=1 Tax=Thauera linaloolentis (strain DSM 12138 / JCM 21573 / CCUG 41526 / CIP 105981 / IAM 15112 / NBRC 102519 / 47Lol) TaxID=1123367 RepID=N6Y5P9_THAL4|nr:PAS/PAC sensor signal transduction histidine kinase [Thauera linaloolentis 47Lol = DSM 12138]
MQGVNTEPRQSPAGSPAAPLDAAQLAEAFALFNRASEELSTAYNALQAQVGQLTERLSVLMGALPAAVVVVDRAGAVVQVNRAAEALFGGTLVGTAWRSAWARLQATETPGEFTLALPAPGAWGAGEEPRRLSLSESAPESGDERIILLHDITDTHRMRLASERNERLAAMGEMVAGLAHQLRTPLAAALLYTGNLRQPELDAAQRSRVADRALERLRYLERLIRDMLLFARGDSLGRQRFHVCELAAELAHTLEPLAKARQIAFEANCGCGDTELVGDRKALGGALTNLLENAIQASEAGACVRFDVATVSAAESGLGMDAVRFAVSDAGRGIAPELQERLFEPFFTTRAEGTGLGLAIARGVARGHGGDILLRSAPGQGSTFTLSLPLSLDAPAGPTPLPPPS